MPRKPTIPSAWGSIDARPSKGGIRYRLRGRVAGTMITVGSFATVGEAQAASKAAARIHGALPKGLTVGTWIGEYIADLARMGRHRDVETIRARLDRYVAPHRLASMLLSSVHTKQIRSWMHDVAQMKATRGKRVGEPLARQTISNALTTLSACFEQAVNAGKITANPCHGVRPPRDAPRTSEQWRPLTLDELACLRRARGTLPEKAWTAFTIAAHTGLRAGELWGLRWQDVLALDDARNAKIRVCRSFTKPTKGNRVRTVPLLPPARDALLTWRNAGGATSIAGLVFPSSTTGEMHTKGYDADWSKRWRRKLGVREGVRFHDLRHTYGTCLLSGEWGHAWPLEAVQAAMGHASRVTTERYAKFTFDALRRATNQAHAEWLDDPLCP